MRRSSGISSVKPACTIQQYSVQIRKESDHSRIRSKFLFPCLAWLSYPHPSLFESRFPHPATRKIKIATWQIEKETQGWGGRVKLKFLAIISQLYPPKLLFYQGSKGLEQSNCSKCSKPWEMIRKRSLCGPARDMSWHFKILWGKSSRAALDLSSFSVRLLMSELWIPHWWFPASHRCFTR